MFICSDEEEFCGGALVREAVCQKLGPGVRNHPGRWTAESRLGPFKEQVHHFLPACQSVPYLSGPDTMLVCVFVCMCGSRQTLRLLNVTRHIQATDPRRRKGKTQRYDGTLQLTGEGGNLIGKKSVWTEWVCVCLCQKEGQGDTSGQLFPLMAYWLFLFSSTASTRCF